MNRNPKDIYCFISDRNKKYYKAIQDSLGDYAISFNSTPKPLKYNPLNIDGTPVEFGTNKTYNSLPRSITNPITFIEDGAAILREFYYKRNGLVSDCYLTVIGWNGETNIYELVYFGKIDISEKLEDKKIGNFTVPVLDDSAWGILSENDDTEFAIDCSRYNPKSIKVLIDGVSLESKYTYQTVQTALRLTSGDFGGFHTMPFVLVNSAGDSYGIITRTQSFTDYLTEFLASDFSKISEYCFKTMYNLDSINISGTLKVIVNFTEGTSSSQYVMFEVWFYRNDGSRQLVIQVLEPAMVNGKTYTVDFDLDFLNMNSGDFAFLAVYTASKEHQNVVITPIVTNCYIVANTKSPAKIVYGLRPLDLAKEIVSKATYGRYTINSEFFETNNKDIAIPGESIRGISNSKIYTSWSSFFKTFDSIYWMALKNSIGNLFIEQFKDVYPIQNTIPTSGVEILDIGEAIEFTTTPAKEYFSNEIIIGSPKQDYRHESGRLEFNSENQFTLNLPTIKNKIELISRYRLDPYGIIFMILDYQGNSSTDNQGDKSVFLVKITDEKDYQLNEISNHESVTINNAMLSPIIKKPTNNDTITYDKPFIRGIGIPSNNVNIYVDGVLDGNTTIDGNGNWQYNINTAMQSFLDGVYTGVHSIEASYTDLISPFDTISVKIDTTTTTPSNILYPSDNDALYNNKPLVSGFAQAGTNINISVDGVFIATVVTNNSCRWEYKFTTPISNGNRILSIGGGIQVPFFVNSFTDIPLITYIGSELDGFPIVNNMPLVEGVATPGTVVKLWLNYISYTDIGTALTDANGNWSFQLVPVSYNDPVTTLPVVVVPIINGLSIISTSLQILTTGINLYGYKLSRPAYNSITGVVDNTIFNTEYSPSRMLENRNPLWSAILQQQNGSEIRFQKSDKNGLLRTVLGTKVIAENGNKQLSSLGLPFAILEYANLKVNSLKSFAQTLYEFNNTTLIKTSFKGKDIYLLPIGDMKMNGIRDSIKEWKLLMSPINSFITLMNLSKNGLTINLMQNAIFHSDYNTLHFVKYDFTQNVKYNQLDIYDNWFSNRNDQWVENPMYAQKIQKSDPLTDQVITRGISSMTLRMYRCRDAQYVASFNYNPANPAPIGLPEVVLRCIIDLSPYPDDIYFFVQMVGETIVSISERYDIKTKHNGTILIEASGRKNEKGFFFSSGDKCVLRVEGLISKYQPSVNSVVSKDESGNTNMLYSSISKQRVIRYGTARGLPDYLAIKVASASILDNLMIEGLYYTIKEDEQFEPGDIISGHPMYYYNVNMLLRENQKGIVFAGGEGAELGGVVLVVDGLAMGLPAGSLLNIELEGE